MAKRFIDTDLFKKQFTRGLQAPYKLLWIYIMTDCNHAGVWECDFDVAQIRLGTKINKAQAEKLFAEKVAVISDGEKWFIPSFIEFQYGKLMPTNRAHTSVISLLQKYDLIDDDFNIRPIGQAPCKPLTSPLQGAKDKDKEKDKDKDKEKDKDKAAELIFPFASEKFIMTWKILINEPKWKKKTFSAYQASLKGLSELANGSEELALGIMQQTIANNYQGFFPLSPHNKSNGQNRKTGHDIAAGDAIADKILSGEITEDDIRSGRIADPFARSN